MRAVAQYCAERLNRPDLFQRLMNSNCRTRSCSRMSRQPYTRSGRAVLLVASTLAVLLPMSQLLRPGLAPRSTTGKTPFGRRDIPVNTSSLTIRSPACSIPTSLSSSGTRLYGPLLFPFLGALGHVFGNRPCSTRHGGARLGIANSFWYFGSSASSPPASSRRWPQRQWSAGPSIRSLTCTTAARSPSFSRRPCFSVPRAPAAWRSWSRTVASASP